MDYRLEQINRLYVLLKEYRMEYDSCFADIPGLWNEYAAQGLHGVVPGMCAVCFDSEPGADFAYGIGAFCKQGDICPEGFVLREIPAYLWAKFRAIGPLPGTMQQPNRKIYTQWMPGNE